MKNFVSGKICLTLVIIQIQAKKHKIGTYEIDKISLLCFDDKRFVLDDKVHTLACFHKDCNKNVIRMKMKIKMKMKIIIIMIMKMIMIMTMILIMIMKNENENENVNDNK